MAARKPIVATKTRANLEILDEETAVLVEPDSPKALAEGIIRVLNDTVLRDRIVENAYQNVQEYTWEKRVAKMVNATIGLRGGGN